MNLADFGLAMGGVNEVLERDRARRIAEEERAYQLDQRRMKQEQDLAAQEDFRRKQSYMQDVRDILPKFLSGGEQAIPAAPEKPAVLGGEQDGDIVLTKPAQAAQPAQDNAKGLYSALQEVAAKHGMLDHYEGMKDRLKKLDDEGVLDFIKKARQGASEGELVQAFNKNGKVKLANLTKQDEGKYVGETEDGRQVSFDIDRMTESLLNPKDLLTHLDRSDKTAATLEGKKLVLEAKDRELTAKDALRRAQTDAASARAERDRAKAGGEGSGRPRTPGNWNQFDRELRSLATSHLSSTDPDTGKTKVDRKNLVTLISMASTLARNDPDNYSSPSEAIAGAVEQLDAIRNIQDRAQSQAEEEASTLTFKDTRQRDQWTRDRTDRLSKMRSDTESAPAAKREAAPPPEKKAAPAGAVATPKSREEFDALEPGTLFVNPADGKTYRKK